MSYRDGLHPAGEGLIRQMELNRAGVGVDRNWG